MKRIPKHCSESDAARVGGKIVVGDRAREERIGPQSVGRLSKMRKQDRGDPHQRPVAGALLSCLAPVLCLVVCLEERAYGLAFPEDRPRCELFRDSLWNELAVLD